MIFLSIIDQAAEKKGAAAVRQSSWLLVGQKVRDQKASSGPERYTDHDGRPEGERSQGKDKARTFAG